MGSQERIMFALIAQLFRRTILEFVPNNHSSSSYLQYASTISGGVELHKNAAGVRMPGQADQGRQAMVYDAPEFANVYNRRPRLHLLNATLFAGRGVGTSSGLFGSDT